MPEGLWLRCDGCGATVFRKQVEQNQNVCPECEHHFYVPTAMRIRQLLDPDSFEEWYADMTSGDPLEFSDRKSYKDRIMDEQTKDRHEGRLHRRPRLYAWSSAGVSR